MTLKAILFDHDGTLVDSEAVHCELWRAVLEPYDVSFSDDEYMRLYSGVSGLKNAQDMVDLYALPLTPEALLAEKEQASSVHLATQGFPLMPGVWEVLRFFQQAGLQLAVVTGAGRATVLRSLELHDLLPEFATVVSCDDVINSKPAPDSYQLAMQQLGLTPQECLAIEDTEHGLAAAVAADLPCVAIPNAQSQGHDFSKASVVLDSLLQTAGWVAGKYQLSASLP